MSGTNEVVTAVSIHVHGTPKVLSRQIGGQYWLVEVGDNRLVFHDVDGFLEFARVVGGTAGVIRCRQVLAGEREAS